MGIPQFPHPHPFISLSTFSVPSVQEGGLFSNQGLETTVWRRLIYYRQNILAPHYWLAAIEHRPRHTQTESYCSGLYNHDLDTSMVRRLSCGLSITIL